MTVTTGQAARQAGEPIAGEPIAGEPIAGEPACPGRRARRWERALLIGGGLAAGWLLAGQVRQIELTALLAAARPAWAAVAVALVAASFLGAAWSLMGFSAVRLRLAPTVLVQIAGGFAKVFSPAALGLTRAPRPGHRSRNRPVLSRPGAVTSRSLPPRGRSTRRVRSPRSRVTAEL